MTAINIGVLAVQGDFHAHIKMLQTIAEVNAQEVRTETDLAGVDALVLPGGESTTIIKLLSRSYLDKEIVKRAQSGMPIYGTCAGLILLAKEVSERPDQPTLQLMDICAARNAFGRQIDSFETDLTVSASGDVIPVRGLFIRAPFVASHDSSVQVLATYRDRVVAVQQGRLLATAFHPELTGDNAIHKYFASIVRGSIERPK